ncbi:sulfurtransferase TusA family protein [Clostridium hydrogeniformans]|uniref:sulfurtransferase TusA family protein n=1 Tax=Clostridium hydrogeniformans TaxID=349933 RepID=UPI000489E05C|nr:sulfurtransferase TusA family protein [Clostridium hydrogeniformans]
MKVDARGRACPEPLLMVKNSLEEGEKNLEILVDTNTALNNIMRYLKNKGFITSTEEEEDYFIIKVNK